MEAIKAALQNKDKPLLPFLVLGFLSVVAVINVIVSWGEYRFAGMDISWFKSALAASFLTYWVLRAHKFSESLFRTPIAALLILNVLYDLWLFRTHSAGTHGLTSLAIEVSWVAAAAVLYFDVADTYPAQAEER